MIQYLQQEMINLANELSHDTGKVCSKVDLIKLSSYAGALLEAIQERMKLDDDDDGEDEDIDEDILKN